MLDPENTTSTMFIGAVLGVVALLWAVLVCCDTGPAIRHRNGMREREFW